MGAVQQIYAKSIAYGLGVSDSSLLSLKYSLVAEQRLPLKNRNCCILAHQLVAQKPLTYHGSGVVFLGHDIDNPQLVSVD